MSTTEYLIDTNILIYHTKGSPHTTDFISNLISQRSFSISILTKIEFLGWDKHTPEGFQKCKKLLELASVHFVDHAIAEKAIELKRMKKIKLADAIIAATALFHHLTLVTRNMEDFKIIAELEVLNPFQ